MKKTCVIFLFGIICSCSVLAADLSPVSADGADQELYGDGTAKWVGQTTARIGTDGETRQNSFVMPFLLPTLPEGESITSASLAITVQTQGYVKPGGGDPEWNIDLYGVRASDTVTVDLNNDGYMGPDDTSATKVEDNFFEGLNYAVTSGVYETSSEGATLLGAWLQSYYTGNTPNQTYAFLRLSPDLATLYADAGGSRYLIVYTGDEEASAPALTITTSSGAPSILIPAFTATPLSGSAPLQVTFTDTSLGTITNRHWVFGDGTTLDTTNTTVQHTYSVEDTYTVSLIVNNDSTSSTNTKVDYITVANQTILSGNTADSFIGKDSGGTPVVYWAGQTTLSAGDDNSANNQADCAAVLVFQLPDLGSDEVTAANLAADIYCNYPGVGDPATEFPKSLDLYAIRTSSSATVVADDYGFMGSGSGMLIQDNFFSMASNLSFDWTVCETSETGQEALAAWLMAQYDGGAQAGDYVFLRLEPDATTSNPITLASANSTEHSIPQLTLFLGSGGGTPVVDPPSPSVITLGGLSAGQDVITWTTQTGSGYVYSVWYSTNLLDGFLPLVTNLADTVHSITNTINASPVFYQIKAQ